MSFILLYRLENIVDQCEKFESDATALETWLRGAQDRIHGITSLDDAALRDLGAIQGEMARLVELRAEADRQQTLKTAINSTGAQLVRHRPNDATIQARIDSIDQQWINLMYKVRKEKLS